MPAGRSLVVMNQLVQVERVDFASVHLREPIADVIEEETQLLLVILGDHLPCRAARTRKPRCGGL